MNPYIGHDSQIYGIEEHRLVGGKGDGLRLYEVNNGKGLMLTVSPDRNGDITRLRFKGINMSYMSPSGYAAPAYFNGFGDNWKVSFTAGFLTTCGLENVSCCCTDDGEELPFHGSIGNRPCEQAYWTEEDGKLVIHTVTKDEVLFGRKLRLERRIEVSTEENSFEICDVVKNTGDRVEPMELLYHMNMGYPLLDEDSIVKISSAEVIPYDDHAAEDIANWMHMEKPTPNCQERCYLHKFADKNGKASIFQPKLGMGLSITFDTEELDSFVEWKSMGVRDYALGLECGNCYPGGRDIMRKTGMLKFMQPGEVKEYHVKITMMEENH
ncbi:MAG: aldose 1-epimerase family protein [Roseburia sp.]|nr:aldose 1-epimerase family protein [Roseburia sp.]